MSTTHSGKVLDFALTPVPERPGWCWEAYLRADRIAIGWTRTKAGARIAMWRCAWRWRKQGRRQDHRHDGTCHPRKAAP